MGLDYTLELSTPLGPAEALSLLGGCMSNLKRSDDGKCLWDKDIIVTAISLGGEARAMTKEAFGFCPDLSVGFRFPSNEDYESFVRMMLRGSLLLLEHGQEGVLLFSMEIIVLQRMEGRLVFNADYRLPGDEHWLEDLVPVPFERRSLPSPLL
jgi:hypothetical protein